MNKTTLLSFLLIVTMALQIQPLRAQEMDKMWGEQKAQSKKTERGRFFEWGNYAMFVHWGLYSQLANQWE